jgi:NAD(P)-dependent dehydrogenase (short-subunit alcohol dehydrogenase family)
MAEKNLSPDALFDMSGRVAVVTGGSTGIGLMQARALKQAGCKVYVAHRSQEKAETAVKTYGFAGFLQADVTKLDDLERIAKEMETREGRVDVLVANAGGPGPKHHGANTSEPTHDHNPAPGGKLDKLSPEAYKREILANNTFENWNDLFALNVSHILFLATAFLPLLAKGSQHGASHKPRPYSSTLITTGSISGEVKQAQMHFAYNASKAAANHLTRLIAFEFTNSTEAHVRVNCIAPGVFPSEMTAGGESDEKNISDLSDKLPSMAIPIARPGEAEDMAQTTQFLAGCEYMHGQTLIVDGGFTLTEP